MRLHKLFAWMAILLGGQFLIFSLLAEELPSTGADTNTPPVFHTELRNEEMVGSTPVRRAYITIGTNEFAFVVPGGYRLDATNPNRVSLASSENNCFLTFRIADFGSLSRSRKFDLDACRERTLADYPNAKILEEFSKTIANHRGPAFDLQWTNSFGGVQAARLIFIPSEAGILEFSIRSSLDVFQEGAFALHQLSLTFHSNEGGALDIPRLSDRI